MFMIKRYKITKFFYGSTKVEHDWSFSLFPNLVVWHDGSFHEYMIFIQFLLFRIGIRLRKYIY